MKSAMQILAVGRYRSGSWVLMVMLGAAMGCEYVELQSRSKQKAKEVSQALKPEREKKRTRFQLVEATIDDVHGAIRSNQTTCRKLVQAYIERAAAYNGTCTQLVTLDGAAIQPVAGTIRAGTPLEFPLDTRPISELLPDFERYAGLPMDFGRMEATISDPSVYQQAGMRVGIHRAGQVNGLATLNLRGERSVTCKGECDQPEQSGALSSECPRVCDEFRRQPDALERASELDAEFGNEPDLARLPMYCIPIAFKDPLDTTDMRSTANADVNYAMDAAPFDSAVVARLRERGAIIYAKANAHEYNGGPGDPGGPAKPTTAFPSDVHAISSWAGQACNPYDTEREPRGSSSGSGVSVSANLVMCSICEQTGGSCKGPASRNNAVSLLTTHGIIPGAGGFPNQFIPDRFGIICRGSEDAALVLDALKTAEQGYFDERDIYTAVPKALVSERPYADYISAASLAGIRIGVVREYFVKNAPNDVAISDLIDEEAKKVLRDQLGAELVESVEPLYPDDSDIPNMKYTFQQAFAEILPRQMPEYFSKKTSSGELEFAVPGHDVTSYAYLLKLTKGLAPLSDALNLRRITSSPDALTTKFGVEHYLIDRGDQRVKDWASLFANARWRDDEQRAGAENWLSVDGLVSEGKTERIKMRDAARLAMLKVMHQNDIDVFIAPENTLPQRKIGGPTDPTLNRRGGSGATQTLTALLGIPEIVVPAGYNQIVYEPAFVLDEDGMNYSAVSGTGATMLPAPMPISMMFWAGPGDEPIMLKVASAYEAATKHRTPPPDFGPLPD